jgi:hypothetical protein
MFNQKTLLISDGFFKSGFIDANEILLEFLTSGFEKGSFKRVFLQKEKSQKNRPDKWNGFEYFELKRCRENRFSSLNRIIPLIINWFIYPFTLYFVIPKQAQKILKIIKKEKIEKIWIVITSPHLIFLIRRLLSNLNNIKIYSTVWDSPEEFSLTLNMPKIFREKMLRSFSDIMGKSVNLGVASENMKNEYEKRFDKKCFVLQGNVISCNIHIQNNSYSGPFVIGYAGSFYTPEVWDALFETFNLINWKINDREVIIRIISNSIYFNPRSKCRIDYWGNRPVSDVIDILSHSFVNFVPYRFSETSKYGSTVSFPSKISTYLAAKRPIFTIAPAYSTPFEFVNSKEVGIACDSLNPQDILKSINRFFFDGLIYKKMINNCERVYNLSFHPEVLSKKFNEFIK